MLPGKAKPSANQRRIRDRSAFVTLPAEARNRFWTRSEEIKIKRPGSENARECLRSRPRGEGLFSGPLPRPLSLLQVPALVLPLSFGRLRHGALPLYSARVATSKRRTEFLPTSIFGQVGEMKPRYGRSFTVEVKPRKKKSSQSASGQPSLYTAALDLQAEAITSSMQGLFRLFSPTPFAREQLTGSNGFPAGVRDEPRLTRRILPDLTARDPSEESKVLTSAGSTRSRSKKKRPTTVRVAGERKSRDRPPVSAEVIAGEVIAPISVAVAARSTPLVAGRRRSGQRPWKFYKQPRARDRNRNSFVPGQSWKRLLPSVCW